MILTINLNGESFALRGRVVAIDLAIAPFILLLLPDDHNEGDDCGLLLYKTNWGSYKFSPIVKHLWLASIGF